MEIGRKFLTAAVVISALLLSGGMALATAFPGPGSFGYQGLQPDRVGLNDVSATGTQEVLSNDDLTGAISLGFNFDFYGTT